MAPSLIIILVAIVIIVLAVLGALSAAKRKKDLAAWAAANGMTFDPTKQRGWDDRHEQFDCLRQGSNRYAHNVTQGAWKGREATFFDYHYETHSRGSKGRSTTHHHRFSGVIVNSPVALKPLFIRPEGFFDKITEFFGYDDIDFESAEFSRKFYVKSPDRKWAYDVIHPRTMEFLLQAPRFTLKFDTDCVIAFCSSKFSPRRFEEAGDVITGILDRLPDYVIRQQQEAS